MKSFILLHLLFFACLGMVFFQSLLFVVEGKGNNADNLLVGIKMLRRIKTTEFQWWFLTIHGYPLINCQAKVAPPPDHEAFSCTFSDGNEFGIEVHHCGGRKSETTNIRVTDDDMYKAAYEVSMEHDLREEDG
ncbi:hypothetical protein FA10DRAFT_259682 [Acaromyces ingoldii]|uniref:Uncharacterized protein n=1 Tax=Acaromyces ingoldii TaxID=215250 RepID=A0A316YTY3_9BASI|nr:hypothetical protein FA10DRAFT_259682 [Acaromyces ingoldii]PWN92516.1 hypothetical protein FA10DRAFT_259682 [Acaromyces ingoldii]